jgi:uncharacterized protein (TIGR03083 family)
MADFTSVSRTQWLDIGQRLFDRIDQRFEHFTPVEWNRVTPYMGWRARDVVAHMASALPVNFREVLDRALAGNPSPPSEFNTFSRNWREVNRRRTMPVSELIKEFQTELAAIMATYRTMSDDDWLKPAWFFVGPVNVRTVFMVQLSDFMLHERDLLIVNGNWHGMDPDHAEEVVDWFMRELRPANFRPNRAEGFEVTAIYRLSGAGAGEWTLRIADGVCKVESGTTAHPDVVLEANTEDLFVAAQARPAPAIGLLSRSVDWIRGPSHTEDVVAFMTGSVSMLSALLGKRIHISGDGALSNRLNSCFWHFWQRTIQTQENIARGTAQ